ncbi:hypothetical protein DTO217A2_1527 [Paecilomyces variotii]|nr:hypothetical protein DTO217A2_1527 [Paecilomyces variotii]
MSSTSKTCSNCAKDLPLSEFVPLRGLKPTAVCLRCREIARRSRLKRIARDSALNKDCVRWRHTTVRRDNRVARRAGDAPRFLRALAPAPTKSPDTTTNKEGDNRSSDITSERTNLTGVEETS